MNWTQSQQEERLDKLLEEHGAQLRWAISRHCPAHLGIRPEDIEQDVRLRLWRAMLAETEITNPASYIYRAVASATIDAVRRARVRREEPLPDDASHDEDQRDGISVPVDASPLPEIIAEQSQILHQVQSALSSFTDERRRAIGLHLQGFTTQQIAQVLGWSEPKARNLLYRGLKELRQRLRSEGIEYEAQ